MFTAARATITYVDDRTISRRAAKTSDQIGALLIRLGKLQSERMMTQTARLQQYKLQLEEDLDSKLKALEDIRAQKQARALKRNEEPKGINRWLLLYRPEGLDGFIVQFFYYVFAMTAVFLVVGFPFAVAAVREWDVSFLLIGAAVYAGLALYPRSISLRMKSVGNAVRLRGLPKPNSDINWLRRNLLLLRKGDGMSGLRFLYYLFLFEAAFLPYMMRSSPVSSPRSLSRMEMMSMDVIMLVFAQVVKADALSRRARLYLSSQAASDSLAESKASSVG